MGTGGRWGAAWEERHGSLPVMPAARGLQAACSREKETGRRDRGAWELRRRQEERLGQLRYSAVKELHIAGARFAEVRLRF